MSILAQTVATQLTACGPDHSGLWRRVKAHCAAITAAHAGQARLTRDMDQVARDTGLGVETILGESTYNPALPFFMQQGFDRR